MQPIKGKKSLQRVLNTLAKATTVAFEARGLISEYAVRKFGVDPADVDFDSFIDACDGGCGAGNSMTAEDFIKGMEERSRDLEKNKRKKKRG